MTCQPQPNAAGALGASAAAMASLMKPRTQYLKYFKIYAQNYTNADYHQKM